MSSLSLKGPAWVTVRQYRRTLWIAGAAVVLAFAVIGGLRIWDAQYPDVRVENGGWVPSPDNSGYHTLRWALEYVGGGAILLPLAVAALVAGPMVAREYESGTYQLSLTQSVSPAAWLRSKLAVAAGVAVLAVLAAMGVFQFGHSRVEEGWGFFWGDPGTYALTGIVLFAHVLAAVAVGALIGQLVRRTLLAMSAAGLVMGVVTLAFTSYRWSILSTERITGPLSHSLMVPEDYLAMDSGLLTPSGARFDRMICWEQANRASGVDAQEGIWGKVEAQCHAEHGITTQFLDYHPVSHLWPTQLIETGIVLALAALATLAAFRVLRARHP
ncbi:ABC transporter permease [Streptomyces sp. CC208A]|uniref:ABC transporter permease n=1 Tax=Streptomyces sp. CC208A TaxID=3044573 RepID=UPI0024A7BC6B|nr:ABC transporter permease [Streptomyces sp. CC208A]